MHLPCFPADNKNCPSAITAKLLLFIKPFTLFFLIAHISLSPSQNYTCSILVSNAERQAVPPDCLPHKQVFISLELTLSLATTTLLPSRNSCANNLAAAFYSLGRNDIFLYSVFFQWSFECFPLGFFSLPVSVTYRFSFPIL